MTNAPYSFDLRTLAERAWRERLRIFGAAFIAGALALGIAFLLPRWYLAEATILPPDESDLLVNAGLASRALSKFPALGSFGEYFTPADIYKATLGSRMAREFVADKFDLRRVYRVKSREKLLKILAGHSRVRLLPDGTITVSVEDRDPNRAAGMAMAYVAALDHYNIVKRNSQGRRTREFLERRVAETDSLLRLSEFVLRAYQETHRTVVPVAPGSGDVQSAADILARKMVLEVRLSVLRSYLREDNDQIVQAQTELTSLEERIAQLPGLQSELARLLRNTKVQEQLYLFLTAELEQARIREQQDTPTVSILDPAVPPERPSKPRKLVFALAGAVLATVGSLVWVSLRPDPPSD